MPRLTPAERAARAERYAEVQEARQAKKQENKARWRESDARNANVRAALEREACVQEAAEPVSSKSTKLLESIMNSPDTAVGHRIDAAEALIVFQNSPGQMATSEASNENIAAGSAFQFLKKISVSPGLSQALQIKTLRLLANIEAIKAARADPDRAAAERETLVGLINCARRHEYHRCGCWARVCASNVTWSLSSADDFDPPSLPGQSSSMSISAALDPARALPPEELQRRHEVRKAALLSITAKGRADNWRRWLDPEAIKSAAAD
jgi:hypothetical protein